MVAGNIDRQATATNTQIEPSTKSSLAPPLLLSEKNRYPQRIRAKTYPMYTHVLPTMNAYTTFVDRESPNNAMAALSQRFRLTGPLSARDECIAIRLSCCTFSPNPVTEPRKHCDKPVATPRTKKAHQP